jgi:hypothetical protein
MALTTWIFDVDYINYKTFKVPSSSLPSLLASSNKSYLVCSKYDGKIIPTILNTDAIFMFLHLIPTQVSTTPISQQTLKFNHI